MSAASGKAHYDVALTQSSRDELFASESTAWSEATELRWGPAPYETRFRALWTTEGLFVRFDAFDIDPWHTLTRHDDPLWDEEVVEIFLDPSRQGHHYAELELSPAGVVCDVRMIRPWPDKEMDLAWDIVGLVTRVTAFPSPTDSTLRPFDKLKVVPSEVEGRQAQGRPERSRRTSGWTATAFLPWRSFASLPTFVSLPPRAGDRWRFNVFRIKRPGGPANPTRGAILAAWSPTGGPSFHVPSAFRDLIFLDRR